MTTTDKRTSLSSNGNINLRTSEIEKFPYVHVRHNGTRLVEALGKQPEPPCVDKGNGKSCEFYRRCAAELLACKSFSAYVLAPIHRKEGRQWLELPRIPSEKTYQMIYYPKAGTKD